VTHGESSIYTSNIDGETLRAKHSIFVMPALHNPINYTSVE